MGPNKFNKNFKKGCNPRATATGSSFLFSYDKLLTRIVKFLLGGTGRCSKTRITLVTSECGYPETTLSAVFHPDFFEVNIEYTEETYQELWENQSNVLSTLSSLRLHDTHLVIFFLGQEQLDSSVEPDRPLSDSMAALIQSLSTDGNIPAFFVMVPPRPIPRCTTPKTYKQRLGKLNDKIQKMTFKGC